MRPRELMELVQLRRPDPPYGARRLARTYSVEDVARAARKRLPRGAMGYLDGGAEDEHTLRANREAFQQHELLPTALRDVSDLDTRTAVLGVESPLPLALAPVGAPRLFHHEGEAAVARAVRHLGVPYAVSTLSTVGIEELAELTETPLWFQLYLWGDRSVARGLLERACSLGYRALLLTVDVSVRSKRERELRAGVKLPAPDLTWRTLLDGARHPSWALRFVTSPAPGFPNIGASDALSAGGGELSDMFDGTIAWEDVDWIREAWPGPLALKGILSPADARRAVESGVDAVIVSNHGGRQLDHLPATIDALPAVVDAVAGRAEVLLDSGVRRGTDILVALALGARAVLIGRPYIYGLAAAGEAGVRHVVDILDHELRIAMALCGASTVAEVDCRMVRRRLARNDG